MDQLRLNFKLTFFFLKNTNSNNYVYFYNNFVDPSIHINYLYLGASYAEESWFNKNIFKKLVEVDNNMFVPKISFKKKKMKCKKIFFKKKVFINLLYF